MWSYAYTCMAYSVIMCFIYVSKHTSCLPSFKVAVCMSVNMKLEMEFFQNVWPRQQTTCFHHLFIRKVSGQRVCFPRYSRNCFMLRLTESFPFIAFISQKDCIDFIGLLNVHVWILELMLVIRHKHTSLGCEPLRVCLWRVPQVSQCCTCQL